MKYLLILTGCMALFYGCSPSQDTEKQSPEVESWNLFFAEAHQKLTSAGSVSKTVNINGTIESHDISLDSLQWSEELSFFRKNNLDKPSWIGKFDIDSSYNGKTVRIHYQRNDDKIPVKEATIKKQDDKIIYFEQVIERSNPISSLNRKLVYAYPDSIVIRNQEGLLFLSDHELSIIYSWK